MQGIQPRTLSDEELLKYAHLLFPNGLDAEWTAEVLKRFAIALDKIALVALI